MSCSYRSLPLSKFKKAMLNMTSGGSRTRGSGGSKFLNELIGKNIMKNKFNMFILINYTSHSCPLRDFIFWYCLIINLESVLLNESLSHYSVSSCHHLPLLMFWSLTWFISAIKIFRGFKKNYVRKINVIFFFWGVHLNPLAWACIASAVKIHWK